VSCTSPEDLPAKSTQQKDRPRGPATMRATVSQRREIECPRFGRDSCAANVRC
jgi:hypothetical protein